MDIQSLVSQATRVLPTEFSNYLVGGNLTNAFALGDVGSSDDFFLVGAPIFPGNGFPIVTGHLLDSSGATLVRIVRNVLTENPGGCRKIVGDFLGFRIVNRDGVDVLAVETQYLSNLGQYVTTFRGELPGKNGELAASLSPDGLSFGKTPLRIAFGFTPTGFGMGMNLTPESIEAARHCLATGGAIHRVIRGTQVDQDITLDGGLFLDVTLTRCRLNASTMDFSFAGKVHLDECKMHFDGQAAQTFRIASALTGGKMTVAE